MVGSMVQGRYRVERPIGEGGMGAVYEALDTRLGSPVALKQLTGGGEQLGRAFEREARLLATLRHQALPRVIDHIVEPQGQFLVMEYISGLDLGELLELQQGPFDVPLVVGWAEQLLEALVYLHGRTPPVIHRDIKPRNIKLSDQGTIILLDFGLAKSLRPTGSLSSMVAYTPLYAPPEQVQGATVDERGDLYSFGATVYALLTGARPADALARMGALNAGRPDPLLPPAQLNPRVPAQLSTLILWAMALDPAQRPASAAQLLAELRGSGRPALGAAPGAPRRGMLWLGGLGLSLLVLAVAGALLLGRGSASAGEGPSMTATAQALAADAPRRRPSATEQPEQPRPSATRSPAPPRPSATPKAELEAPAPPRRLQTGWSIPAGDQVESVDWDRAGALLLFSTYNETNLRDPLIADPLASFGGGAGALSPDGSSVATIDGTRLVLWAIDGSERSSFEIGEAYRLAWSPDGGAIASFGGHAPVQVWGLDGKLRLTLEQDMVDDVDWSPDGSMLATGDSYHMVKVWSAGDGALLHTFAGHGQIVSAVDWHPNGYLLASGGYDGNVRVWSLARDEQIKLFADPDLDEIQTVDWSPEGLHLATGGNRGYVRVWQLAGDEAPEQVAEHSRPVWVVRWSPGGDAIVSGGGDGVLQLTPVQAE